MKRSRFSEEQIIAILKEAEAEPVKTVCARHNLSQATYYQWKSKFGGMEVEEARRLRALEDECGRLKRIVADQAIQIRILKEVNSKKNGKPGKPTAGSKVPGGRRLEQRGSRLSGSWAGAFELLPGFA
jgi:putative transposase